MQKPEIWLIRLITCSGKPMRRLSKNGTAPPYTPNLGSSGGACWLKIVKLPVERVMQILLQTIVPAMIIRVNPVERLSGFYSCCGIGQRHVCKTGISATQNDSSVHLT